MSERLSFFHKIWILPALFLALPVAASTSRIYVANAAGTSVDIIDSATNKVVQSIDGIEVPHAANFSPDGSRVYISNESESVLNIVDRKSGNTIKKVALSGHPNNLAVSNDGKRVFICIVERPGALDIVDAVSMTLAKTIPMKAPLHNPYVTPDGKYVVVGSVPGKFISVIDLATETPAWELQLDKGVRPMAIEAAPDGSTSRIFAQLSDLNGFAVIDFAKRAEVARIKVSDEVRGSAQRGDSPAHGIAISPDGKTLWANSEAANAVFIYSLPGLKPAGKVALPQLNLPGRGQVSAAPNWITFAGDGKTAYISISGARSVSAIDTKALKEIARIRVGEVPKRINTLVLP